MDTEELLQAYLTVAEVKIFIKFLDVEIEKNSEELTEDELFDLILL